MNEQYLKALEIDLWKPREDDARPIENAIAETTDLSTSADTWEMLQEKVKNCTLCDLHKSRTQTVFGIGNKKADLMLIGEAPGANEDAQGEPFVGRAGQLLTSMIQSIGLTREQVYIANILKCRPPNNRDPKPEEERCCTPYLIQQIELVNPKLIVAVGRIAAQFLLETEETMGKMRTQLHHYGPKNIPVIVIYHPAYLLRSPGSKAKAYENILRIKKNLQKL